MIEKSNIGKEYPERTFEIEKCKIRELARAIGDKNKIFYDEDAAREDGFEGMAVPPTFFTLFAMAGGLEYVIKDLEINMAKLLHGGQEYEYFKPAKPGDVVKAKTIITDVIEKSGKAGTMDFVVMETTYINQNEEPVLRDKCTLVVRR